MLRRRAAVEMATSQEVEAGLRERIRVLEEELARVSAPAAKPSQEVSALHERLSLIVEETQVGIWDWDPVADVATWNARAYEMFGLQAEHVPATFRNVVDRVHPEDVNPVRLALLKHLGRGERFGIDLRAMQADGSYRWVHVSGRALRDEQGKPYRVVGLLMDIDERKREEERAVRETRSLKGAVDERTRELELARQELEEFCYAVSHDLRTPLRSINGFSRALETEYAPKFDDLGLDYLRRIQKASVTLADLLDGMLAMVRISRVEMHVEEIDVSKLAQALVEEFDSAYPQRKVRASVQRGMRCEGDPRLVRLLLANLISNAWKFTSGETNATVDIGCANDAFFVKDNGAGFDMRYSDKLYKPFQKLHSSARFPGTGIGLATAHRIASRHGGALWAESREGHGATFYFRLQPSVELGVAGG